MLYELDGLKPQVDASCFVAPSAQLIGKVHLLKDASAWFNVVIRGDNDLIEVGSETNIQDGSILHTDAGIELKLGRGVTVGHKVMLHGCQVGDFSLIGMNAVVLNRAFVGRYCLIGAGALVTEGRRIPDGSVVMGAPGKVVREVTEAERLVLEGSAAHYVQNARRYRQQLTLL